MDHGVYARLGETVKSHHADVRIICATTENPTSSLLNTFVRRIPIIIQLPNFSDRPAKEKIDLLKVMVSMEAARIQRRISLSEDVVKALIEVFLWKCRSAKIECATCDCARVP